MDANFTFHACLITSKSKLESGTRLYIIMEPGKKKG